MLLRAYLRIGVHSRLHSQTLGRWEVCVGKSVHDRGRNEQSRAINLSSAPTGRRTLKLRNMSSTAVLTEPSRAQLATIDLSGYDAEQSRLMDERCILVDEQDRPLGAADKKTCELHLSISAVCAHVYRPSYGKYQQGTSSSRLLCFRFPTERWQVTSSATRFREDHIPGYVDQHLLLPSSR
jgi:hypothetical protein